MAVKEPAIFPRARYGPSGDLGILVEFGEGISESVNQKVRIFDRALRDRTLPGIIEAVPAYRSLLIVYDPLISGYSHLIEELQVLESSLSGIDTVSPNLVHIPVAYGGLQGPDLASVAGHNGLSTEDVVRLHASAQYLVLMTGFTPGFPYLGGLPERIATPRLKQPRLKVPEGSVGIAGMQTGIYPLESPGGWQLIGRTPLRLFDPSKPDPVLLHVGDRVQFHPISTVEFDESFVRARQSLAADPVFPEGEAKPFLMILRPGVLATIQDMGRCGYLRVGIPTSGAMDRYALSAANMLAGNAENAAGIEITLWGAQFEFLSSGLIACTGADLEPRLNGNRLPMWSGVDVKQGDRLDFGSALCGCRAYLAVAGGIAVPPCLGSRSTYLRAHIGGYAGRALQPADKLSVMPAVATVGPLHRGIPRDLTPSYDSRARVRVILGPQEGAFTSEAIETLLCSEFQITPSSDRMGYRLAGPRIHHRESADIISDAIPMGAIQVPGDGQSIMLMADRQTTGGYAKIANVIAADLDRAGQFKPGDRIRFEAVSLGEAHRAYRDHMARVQELRSFLST